MFLRSIRLFNFRNHSDAHFEFSEGVNCIVGENGVGKSNVLDAIYFLALSKSSIQKQDQFSITYDELMLVIDGIFVNKEHEENITLSVQKGQKKTLLVDKVPYERISEHIGKYPLVLIAPDDTDMIRDASDTRRKLFDGIIAQVDAEYLSAYQKHNRLLDQRNSLLKQFAERAYFDQEMLDSYSSPLVGLAIKLGKKRMAFLKEFEPEVKSLYKELSGGKEELSIVYQTEVLENFERKFKQNERKDRAACRTTMGVHKDEYAFLLDGLPAKKFGSQGQKKSFILSVRMAQFQLLERHKGVKPLLLLDDIFDKLDDSRIKKLIEKIDNHTFGQVFITDARPERTKKILENVNAEVKYINL